MPESRMAAYLALLPGFMVSEINRYRNLSDRQSRLLSRLMLLKYLRQERQEHLIHQWARDAQHKPFIGGWKSFNIAHSGDITAFCVADHPVGLDVERVLPVDVEMMADHFRPEEKKYIVDSDDALNRFYDIWVRKEAVLKAAGAGIVNGLTEVCCLERVVSFQQKDWYLRQLEMGEEYTAYVCTGEMEVVPVLVGFDPGELMM